MKSHSCVAAASLSPPPLPSKNIKNSPPLPSFLPFPPSCPVHLVGEEEGGRAGAAPQTAPLKAPSKKAFNSLCSEALVPPPAPPALGHGGALLRVDEVARQPPDLQGQAALPAVLGREHLLLELEVDGAAGRVQGQVHLGARRLQRLPHVVPPLVLVPLGPLQPLRLLPPGLRPEAAPPVRVVGRVGAQRARRADAEPAKARPLGHAKDPRRRRRPRMLV
mmetsp:Transcript_4209/g.10625  ORF Transcript_4209/g.10625 Transcript_4209/m.10625 type:complete len:220 (-) Transcript_4209:262-921(-)